MDFFTFFSKYILKVELKLVISGWVDATPCSKSRGGMPPVPPPLTRGLIVVVLQPIRELEFRSRLSDFLLSSKNGNLCQDCKQLSLLCETMTYFNTNYAYCCVPSSLKLFESNFRNALLCL